MAEPGWSTNDHFGRKQNIVANVIKIGWEKMTSLCRSSKITCVYWAVESVQIQRQFWQLCLSLSLLAPLKLLSQRLSR